MLESFDFLPEDLNYYIKAFIYTLIIIHILAFTLYFMMVCPALFKKKN